MTLLKRPKGFTLVELSVVIVVIAILASVAIVSYGSWRQEVSLKQVSSDLTQAAAAMENAKTFSKTGYPAELPTTFVPSPGITVEYISGNATSFCIEATNETYPDITYSFKSNETEPLRREPCASATLYTNLAHNPRPTSGTYYKSSSTGAGTVSFTGSDGGESVRMTRVSNAALALYIERTTGGMMVAEAGDQYTVRYDIYSPINTYVTSQIGYGSSTSTSAIGGTTNQTVSISSGSQSVYYTFTVPSGYDGQPLFLKVLWSAGEGTSGNYFSISRLMVVKGVFPANADYGDGDYGDGWDWEGTPNGSPSTGPALFTVG